MKTINRLSDLPAEFQLANYAPVASFGLAEWLMNLEARTLRLYMWSFDEKYAEELRPASKRMLQNPAIEVRGRLEGTGLTKYVHPRQVRDQTVFQALAGVYWLDDSRFAKWTAIFRDMEADEVGKGNPAIFEHAMWEAVRDTGVDDDGEVSVTVNIHASEEQLLSDFRRWLTDHKKARGLDLRRTKVRATDFAEWSKFQVLAYLDLKFWAKTCDTQITNQIMGMALFPDEYEVALAERIRKVVMPLAERLANEEFCNLLRAQLMDEAAESNSRVVVPEKFASIRVAPDGTLKFAPDGA